VDLSTYVSDFAAAIKRVDSTAPCAVNARSGQSYRPGIGPHTEDQTVAMVMANLSQHSPALYGGAFALQVPYPMAPRSKLDIAFGNEGRWRLCIEVKMLRLMGDNGLVNDNMLMHILSPYPAHRSAVTDTEKLLRSGFSGEKGLVIYAYEYPKWSSLPAIEAFEALATRRVCLERVASAASSGLVHPVHTDITVYGWRISAPSVVE
jgi:hypothetical protein